MRKVDVSCKCQGHRAQKRKVNINKYKGCVKQKQLAKFAEEPKPRAHGGHGPTNPLCP